MFETIDKALRSKIFWIVAIILIVYLYLKIVVYTYWKRHGIPHDKPTVPFGTLEREYLNKKITLAETLKRSYEKFKKHPFHGLYMLHQPILSLNDPEVIKHVLVKEFASFPDRVTNMDLKIDPLHGNLFLLGGEEWRWLRIKLSPTLTSGKLKHMYPIIQEMADEMINIMNEDSTDVFEFKEIVARYTTDTICSLAFGFDPQSQRNSGSEFRHYGDMAVEANHLKSSLLFFAPSLLRIFKIRFFKPELSKFFINLFKEMVEKRRASGTNRKDLLSLLIELIDTDQMTNKESNSYKAQADDGPIKQDMLIASAQAFVYFTAGFETSSTMVAYTLYELALNPEEQEKVHKEIDELLENYGSFNYDNILRLQYLEMAFFEALRKHPSVPFLNRMCVQDCKLPNSDFVVPKGMPISISVSAIHRDPNYYPDPEKFDPTRFSKENMKTRHPYTFLPFGGGQRYCIGKRLGMTMSMVALATLLSNFKFLVCEKTVPISYSLKGILQAPRDGVYLQVEKRCAKH